MNINAAQLGLGALFSGPAASAGKATAGDEFFSLLSSLLTGTGSVAASFVEGGTAGDGCVAETDSALMPMGTAESVDCDCDAGGFVIDDSVVMPVVLFAAVPSEDGTKTVSVSVSGVEGKASRTMDTADGKSRIAIPVEVTISVAPANADSAETGDEGAMAGTVQISALLLLDESALTEGVVSQPALVLLPDENDATEMETAGLLAGLISPVTPMESFIPDSRIMEADDVDVSEMEDVDGTEILVGDDGEYDTAELDGIDAGWVIPAPDVSPFPAEGQPVDGDDFAVEPGGPAGIRFASMTEAAELEPGDLVTESALPGSGDWGMTGEPVEDDVRSVPRVGNPEISVDEAAPMSGETDAGTDAVLSDADGIPVDEIFTSAGDSEIIAGMDDSFPAEWEGEILASPQGNDAGYVSSVRGVTSFVTDAFVVGDTGSGIAVEDASTAFDETFVETGEAGTFAWTDFESFPDAEAEGVSVEDVRALFERFTADDGTVRLTVAIRPEARMSVDDPAVAEEPDAVSLADGEIPEMVLSEMDGDIENSGEGTGVAMEDVPVVSGDDATLSVMENGVRAVRVDGSREKWVMDRVVSRTMTTEDSGAANDGTESTVEWVPLNSTDETGLPLFGDDAVPADALGETFGDSGKTSPLIRTTGTKNPAAPELNTNGPITAETAASPESGNVSRDAFIADSDTSLSTGISVDASINTPAASDEVFSSGTSPVSDVAVNMGEDNSMPAEERFIPVRITRMTRETGFVTGKAAERVSAPEEMAIPDSSVSIDASISEIGSVASEPAAGMTGAMESTDAVIPDGILTDQAADSSSTGTDVPETGHVPRVARHIPAPASASGREGETSPDNTGLDAAPSAATESRTVLTVTEEAFSQTDASGVSPEKAFPASTFTATVTVQKNEARALTTENGTDIAQTDGSASVSTAANGTATEGGTSRRVGGATVRRVTVKTAHSSAVSPAAAQGNADSGDAARVELNADALPMFAGETDSTGSQTADSTDTALAAAENSAAALSEENGKANTSRNAERPRRVSGNDTAAVSAVSASCESDGELSGGMGDDGTGLTGRGMASAFTNDGPMISGGTGKFGETLSRKVAETDSLEGNVTATAFPSDASSTFETVGDIARTKSGHHSSGTGEAGKNVLDTIVRQARMLLGNGQSSVMLLLDPPSLGRLKLEIVTEGSKVSGKIIVESKEVQDIVRNNISELRQSLSQNGLQVESFDVHVGHNDGTDGWARREDMESMASNLRSSREQGAGMISGAATVTDSRGRSGSRHPGLLDVWM